MDEADGVGVGGVGLVHQIAAEVVVEDVDLTRTGGPQDQIRHGGVVFGTHLLGGGERAHGRVDAHDPEAESVQRRLILPTAKVADANIPCLINRIVPDAIRAGVVEEYLRFRFHRRRVVHAGDDMHVRAPCHFPTPV